MKVLEQSDGHQIILLKLSSLTSIMHNYADEN